MTENKDIVFDNPNAVSELETTISKVYTVRRGRGFVDGEFSINAWDHWLSVITWTVDKHGRTKAQVLIPADDGGEACADVYPFAVTMYRPVSGQTDVCLCFARLPDEISSRETYKGMAVPLGGAFSSATRMAMENAIDQNGGLQLGAVEIKDLPALPPGSWFSNPFDGRTEFKVQTQMGRKRSGVVAWYHGKVVKFEGTIPPLNTEVRIRILREDFQTITAFWLMGDGQVASTAIVRRKPLEEPAAVTEAPADPDADPDEEAGTTEGEESAAAS